jgi:filamentous hemagglutinin family protein
MKSWQSKVSSVRWLCRGLGILALASNASGALAQAVPSPSAPAGKKALLDSASNGVPIVNIAPPGSAGVSHNLFTSFNIGSNGLIVNNRPAAGTTTLGGSIRGNPQLGPVPAKLVLGEVVGTGLSSMLGRLEIAGASGDFVLANSNGITCNGCGFVNVGRAVLTSGRPDWWSGVSGGALSGYSVTSGSVQVGPLGLSASGLSDLSLVAGQVLVQGAISDGGAGNTAVYAVAGANRVAHSTLQTVPLARTNALPPYAIDVATLGSIHARQIYLVSTEPGAGLNHSGSLSARAGGITLDVSGNLTHQGTLQTSAGGAVVASAASIEQRTSSSTVSGTGGVTQAPGGLVLMQARNDTTLKYATLSGGDLLITAGGGLKADNAKLAATGDVRLSAGSGELDFLAGTVDVGGNLALYSASNLTLRAAESSSTATTSAGTVTTTVFDKPLFDANGDVSIQSSGGGVTLDGVRIGAGRSLAIQAPAVQVLARKNLSSEVTVSGRTTTKPTTERLVPTALNAGADLSILATGLAGRDDLGDIFITGAEVKAGTGQLSLLAARDVDIASDTTTDTTYSEYYRVKRRLFSKTVTREIKTTEQETITPSVLLGATVSVGAGRNLSFVASEVQADGSVGLHADGDLSLLSMGANNYAYSDRTVKKSGIFASGSLGVTIGSRSTQQIAGQQALEQTATQVSSLFGDIAASAGNQYLQMSSALIAPLGSIAVSAKDVAFQTNNNTRSDFSLTRMQQWGLTVQAGHPWLSTAQAAQDAIKKAQATDSGHHRALAGMTAALSIYNAYSDANKTKGNEANAASGEAQTTLTNGWTLSVGLQNSASSFHSLVASTTPVESMLDAGRDVSVTAWGTGADQGDITAVGAALTAGGNATLKAARDIHLLAAVGSTTEATRSKSSSGAIGLTFALGSTTPAAVTLAASRSRGYSNGWGTSYFDTQVTAGQTLDIASGRDLTLKGAKASGTRVTAKVGTAGAGNLTIATAQDDAHYNSKETSAGFSLSVPMGPGVLSGTLSYANAKLLADWQSAREQSAIVAGSGGFDVAVNGHTHLRGGALSSETSGNRFVTQSLTHETLINRDYAAGSATSVSLSIGVDPSKPGLGGSSIGWASVNRSSLAPTASAVAPGVLTVSRPDLNAGVAAQIKAREREPLLARRAALQAELDTLLAEQNETRIGGNAAGATASLSTVSTSGVLAPQPTAPTKAAIDLGATPDLPVEPYPGWWSLVTAVRAQIAKVDNQLSVNTARSLQDQTTVSRAPNTSHQPLLQTFDPSKATAQLKTDAAITAAFGREAFRAVGTQADKQREAAESACKANLVSACADVARWAEGGAYRIALHAAVGGASFGVQGAAGVVTSAAAQEVLSASLTKALNSAGITNTTAINTMRGVMSLAAGAAAAGAAGAATGFSVDANNRQLHIDQIGAAKRRARELAGIDGKSEKQWEIELTTQLLRQSDGIFSGFVENSRARAVLAALESSTGTSMSSEGTAEHDNPSINADQLLRNASSYLAVGQLPKLSQHLDLLTFSLANAVYTPEFKSLPMSTQREILGQLIIYSELVNQDQRTTAVQKQVADVATRYAAAWVRQQDSSQVIVPAERRMGQSVTESMIGAAIASSQVGGRLIDPLSMSPKWSEAELRSALNQEFKPQGLSVNAEVMGSAVSQRLIQEIIAGSPLMPTSTAVKLARGMLESGAAVPTQISVAPGTVLFKAVPAGESVDSKSSYWIDNGTRIATSKMSSQQLADFMGLPAWSQLTATIRGGYDLYSITVKPEADVVVFKSTVAPTDQGLIFTRGGGSQIIVPNRDLWTLPMKVTPGTVRVVPHTPEP